MGAAKRKGSGTTRGSRSAKKSTTKRKAAGSARASRASSKPKAAARKTASRKAASRKTGTRKPAKATTKPTKKAAKRPARKAAKPAAKRSSTRKAAKKRAAPRKAAAKKSTRKTTKKAAKKATRKKTAATTASKKRTATRKSPAKRSSAKKAPAKQKAPAKRPARSRATAAKTATATSRTKSKAAPKKSARPAARKPAKSPAKSERKTKTASKAVATKTRSQQLPETQSERRGKTARRTKTAKTAGSRKARPAGAKTLPLVTAKKPGAEAKPKKKREKKPKPPAKTMNAPEPIREVLVFDDIPDVRRALTAKQRREGARGHLQPSVADVEEEMEEERQPLDATLIMNTLAVDVQPKIEDNYDYTVLDEFRESGHCPRPTRMVNTGCGGGEASVYFAKLGFNCVGIDPDRSDVGLARERAWLAGVDIDFMVGDLFETPNLLPAESFGLAVDRGAFFHIEDERDRQRYLANIKRLLFRGGVLLLSAGYFPFDDEATPRKVRGKKGGKILLAREGGVVVQEMRAAGFELLKRVLRQTEDSGELGELLLYLRK